MVCWSLQRIDTIDKSADEFVPVPMPNPSRITNAIATLRLAPDDYLHGRYQSGPSYIMVEHEDDLDQVVQHWNTMIVAAWDNKEIYTDGAHHPIVGKVPRTFIKITSQPCVKPEQQISAYNDYPVHCKGQLLLIPLNHPWIEHPKSEFIDAILAAPIQRQFTCCEFITRFIVKYIRLWLI